MIGSPMIWPAMGALALAVGLGVQLGESAVREIDPLYFQGPVGRPMGIDPVAQAPAPSPYAQAYGWEQGNAARLAASGIDYPYAPTPVSLVEPIVEPARQDALSPPPSLAPWPPGQVSIHPEIERYTDYPIERKDADAEAPDEELAAPVEAGK
jgi:hypothetical protein